MSLPTSRETLKQWCLRKMGEPLIKINVSEDQLQDRIDEALSYFEEFHYDGTQTIYVSHLITATIITFSGGISGVFSGGEIVTGTTSGAIATVIDQASNNLSIRVHINSGTFEVGETVSNGSGVSGVVSSITLGDIDNRYITMDDEVVNVIRILSTSGLSNSNWWSINYQYSMEALSNMTQFNITQFVQLRQHYSMLLDMLTGQKPLRFNRNIGNLYIDMDWGLDDVDQWIVLECDAVVDPTDHAKVYGNIWLRSIVEALFTIQWGQNLIKFGELALVGGVRLNGAQILERGQNLFNEEIKKLRTEYEEPPMFTMA